MITKTSLALLSGACLVLAFPPHDWYVLAWIGFVPLFIALEKTTWRQAWLLGSLMGTAGFMAAFPWMLHVSRIYLELPLAVTYFVWAGYALIHAQLFGLAAAAYRFIRQRLKLPPIILLPVIFTAVWSLVPTLFFFNLANGTVPFTIALQPLEITGAWGLDLVMFATSAFLYSIVRFHREGTTITALAVTGIIIAVWFTTGYALGKTWSEKISTWEKVRIGIVQPHRHSSRFVLPHEKGFSKEYPLAMHLSLKLKNDNPHLVIWPEGNLYRYFEDLDVHQSFMKNVKKLGAPLLFHDYPYDFRKGRILYRNSSVFLSRGGSFRGRYDKRYIMPFGEYIPFLDYEGKLAQWLNVPPPLTPGDGPKTFTTEKMHVQPMICYEVMFPEFVADSTGSNPKGKILVVQSNDGWYGTGGQVFQHNSAVYLRAVEHRLPVIHVLNNGPSLAVSPHGTSLFTAPFWERGSWTVPVPFSPESGGTFYSRHPRLVLFFIRGSFLLLLLLAFSRKMQNYLLEKRNVETGEYN